jgi:hypothetical protein
MQNNGLKKLFMRSTVKRQSFTSAVSLVLSIGNRLALALRAVHWKATTKENGSLTIN